MSGHDGIEVHADSAPFAYVHIDAPDNAASQALRDQILAMRAYCECEEANGACIRAITKEGMREADACADEVFRRHGWPGDGGYGAFLRSLRRKALGLT